MKATSLNSIVKNSLMYKAFMHPVLRYCTLWKNPEGSSLSMICSGVLKINPVIKTVLTLITLIMINFDNNFAQAIDGDSFMTYYGNMNSTEAVMTLNKGEDGVQGKIDAGGYLYHINGKIIEGRLEGELIDPHTQARMVCNGKIADGEVRLNLSYPNSSQSADLVFYREREKVQVDASAGGNSGAAGDGERDPALIGNWLYSDSYTSGDYGFVSQWRLIVNSDGTYLYGDAKLAGGGPGTSASSEGGGYTRGQWKTQNKTIFINEGNGWQPYAGYYIEGNSMLMKFSDGSKQVWKRY